MKKHYTTIALFICSIFFSTVKAQHAGVFDYSGIAAVSQNTLGAPIAGGGIHMSMYSPALNIFSLPDSLAATAQSPLALRFGVDGMIAFMGHDKFKGVPLISPESGNATVQFQNTLYALNLSARFTSSCFNGKILPYADVFAGYRMFYSSMTIRPDDNTKKQTNSTLSQVSGINTGVGAGLMIALSSQKDILLNVGIAWSHSGAPGKFVDMSRVERSGNSLVYYSRPAVEDFMMLNVGLSGLFSFRNNHSSCDETDDHHHYGSYYGHSGSCGGGNSHVSVIAR